jgi:hypothetical protein
MPYEDKNGREIKAGDFVIGTPAVRWHRRPLIGCVQGTRPTSDLVLVEFPRTPIGPKEQHNIKASELEVVLPWEDADEPPPEKAERPAWFKRMTQQPPAEPAKAEEPAIATDPVPSPPNPEEEAAAAAVALADEPPAEPAKAESTYLEMPKRRKR